MNEHMLREQLQNEVRRCAEAVARAQEAEADRDQLADALEAERQQVAVESGESDRLEALLEAESRLRRGLTITADSLAAKLNEVNTENDRLAAIVGSCPRCSQRVEITPESLGAPSYAALAAENDRLRAMVLDELTREGQALIARPQRIAVTEDQRLENAHKHAATLTDRPPVPDVEVPPESSPDEDRSGGADPDDRWGDYMRGEGGDLYTMESWDALMAQNERLAEDRRERNAEIDRLRGAVSWLLTEMPVGWEDIAGGEGRHDVVAVARSVTEELDISADIGGEEGSA